jgi:hypothetical protein
LTLRFGLASTMILIIVVSSYFNTRKTLMLEKHDLPEDNSTNKPNIESFIIYKGLPDPAAQQILNYLSLAEVMNLEQLSKGHQQQLNKFLPSYFYSECQRNAAFGLFRYLWESPSEDSFTRYMLSYYELECSIEQIPWLYSISSNMDGEVAAQQQKNIQNIILDIKKLHENYPEYTLDIFSSKSFDFKKVNIVELSASCFVTAHP